MNNLPSEILDIIVSFSTEKNTTKSDKPHEFLVVNYNINPWRAVSKQFMENYKNPPPTLLQIPECLIS